MGIRQDWQRTKWLLSQGSELLWLRLRLLRWDLRGQLAQMVKIAIMVAAAAVLLMVALGALMIALYVWLPAQAKVWVFGSLGVLTLLASAWLLWRVPVLWKQCAAQTTHTLNAISGDLRLLQRQLRPDSQDAEIIEPDKSTVASAQGK